MTNRPVDELPAVQMASTRDEGEGPGDNDLPEAVQQIVTAAGPAPEFGRYVRRPEPSLLVVLTGPSGVGKSSFLRAGLLPRLRRDDQHFLPLPVIRPERAAISGATGLAASLEAAFHEQGVAQSRADIRQALQVLAVRPA